MTFKAPLASTCATSLRFGVPAAADSSSSVIAPIETSSPDFINARTTAPMAPFAMSGFSLSARIVFWVRSISAAARAAASGFFIRKAFVFVFGAKAQVAGGVASAPGHCLGRVHRDAIPPVNTSTYPCGLTDLRAPVAASVAAREPAGPRVVLPLRAGWRRLVRFAAWLDDCWIGDLIGVVSLFALLWMFLLMGAVFG